MNPPFCAVRREIRRDRYGIGCLGTVQRSLGLLALAMGRSDVGREHLAAAVRLNRQVSATLPLAYTLADYGLALSTVNPGEAALHLAEAKALARACNLTALIKRLDRQTSPRTGDNRADEPWLRDS